jgi:lincosamide nucleotidyltransferase A/C/D/E
MTVELVVDLLGLLDDLGVKTWLDGGWAVDAALGTQRRPHDDLDLVVALSDVDTLIEGLARRGFERVHGDAPKSFELVDAEGAQVDVHPVVFTSNGDGDYVLETGDIWSYPARGFAGEGEVAGRAVRCLTPEVQMLCHTGYEPHRTSFDDVRALSARFGLPVPEQYAAPRDTYPNRL